ncbi:MAG: NAD-dependent epimerase/dehydratase family protein [Planctomycetes bacterium]|nr:NAD-dependent epimerase/dehydratase family protein [Planctomycetota bacterium]
MNPHVLLTGATGFVGTRLVPRLVAAGFHVHATARAGSPRAALADQPVTWHAADLCDRAALGAALKAARRAAGAAPLDVLHCGAVISYRTRDRALQRRVNVEGTAHVLDAAVARDVRRFLFVSSVVTVGHARGAAVLDEDAPFNGGELHVDYVDTKRAAEELVLARGGELETLCVNPSAIFGVAGPRSNSAYFLQRVAAGGVAVAPPGSVSVVGVDDVADGTVAALLRGRPGRRYLLSESWLPLRALLAQVADLCGVPGPRFVVPPALWRAATLAARGADLLHGFERLTPQAMRMTAAHFRVRADRARAELDWTPRPIGDVLREAVAALGLARTSATPPGPDA